MPAVWALQFCATWAPEVAGGEVGYGGAGLGQGRDRLLAPLDAVDNLGGAEARLRCCKLAVAAEGDPPGHAPAPALDDVDLAARGVDPDPEARQLPVQKIRSFPSTESPSTTRPDSVSSLRRGIAVRSQQPGTDKRKARRHHDTAGRSHRVTPRNHMTGPVRTQHAGL